MVSTSDYVQIERILTTGCPYEFNFEETSESKLKMIKRGNQKSFNQHPDQAKELVNKEDSNSHIFVMHDWVCQLAPNMRHTAQGMVMKDGKGRVVWDGSTKLEPLDVVMNDYTPIENEPEVTFGTAKIAFYWLIYNMRASFPDTPIFLAL